MTSFHILGLLWLIVVVVSWESYCTSTDDLRAKLQDFIDLLHVYPTMAEALKIVAISRYKAPAKLSCCAE